MQEGHSLEVSWDLQRLREHIELCQAFRDREVWFSQLSQKCKSESLRPVQGWDSEFSGGDYKSWSRRLRSQRKCRLDRAEDGLDSVPIPRDELLLWWICFEAAAEAAWSQYSGLDEHRQEEEGCAWARDLHQGARGEEDWCVPVYLQEWHDQEYIWCEIEERAWPCVLSFFGK